MKVRLFDVTDTAALFKLFRQTVHKVCRNDYTQAQLDAWAPKQIDLSKWESRFLASYTLIAEDEREILGFSNLEPDGNIDMLYVGAKHQGEGIAKNLLLNLENEAINSGIKILKTDASLTARPFFEKMGFRIDEVYSKESQGQIFKNTLMSKSIAR